MSLNAWNSSSDVTCKNLIAAYGNVSLPSQNICFLFSNDLISAKVLEAIEFVFGCVLINVFAFLGLVTTSINLAVLSRCNITKDSSNILLVSLCVADFLFCLTIPIRSSLLLTPLRMKLVSILVYAANFLLFSPTYFSFTHDYFYSQKYGALIPVLQPTEFYKNNYEAINIHLGIVYNIAILGSSLLLTLVLTPVIATRLWMLTSRRTKLTQRKCSVEPQVAKTLLAICTMSLVIYGPTIGYNAATIFLPQYSVLTRSYLVFLIITDFSGCVCASANFIIYVTMSNKFRQRYKVLIYRLRFHKPNGIEQKI